MKNRLRKLCRYLPWLLLLLGIDAISALLLWIADINSFFILAPLILIMTVLIFVSIAFILDRAEQKKEQAFEAFLNNPDKWQEENLLKAASVSDSDSIRKLGEVLREKQEACQKADAEAEDYEEYVEAWAHEIKTPLSLLTMILDNQSDVIPASTNFKLDYIRNQIQEQISQILYYARLKSAHKSYLFEFVDLRMCMEEILEDYRMLLEEKQFLICEQLFHTEVFTDRRGIQFLLSQIISNAIKYSSDHPKLTIILEQSEAEETDILRIRDNGIGVKACDLPYIFQKGFTGDSENHRNKATGMGLYLSKKMADDLNIRLEVWSEWGKGFEISMFFPKIKKSRSR